MLFRSSKSSDHRLHLLYLIHELPTRGIYKEALSTALEERRLLLGPGKLPLRAERAGPIRIIGPNFSGSALSLQLALKSWLARHPEDSVEMLSGTATSRDNIATLDLPALRMRFRATINADDQLSASMKVTMKRLGLSDSQVALLRESSTQYGQGLIADCSDFLIVPFPMSISSLRTEYQRVPSAEEAAPALPGAEKRPGSRSTCSIQPAPKRTFRSPRGSRLWPSI